MSKEVIQMAGSPQSPKGLNRPFSPAIRAGDYIFVSGFHGGGTNPRTGETYSTIEAQTRQSLIKIELALKGAGASMSDIVKVTVFIDSAANFEKMNIAYAEFFPSEPPARSAVVTQFVRPGMLIQIDCIAYRPKS